MTHAVTNDGTLRGALLPGLTAISLRKANVGVAAAKGYAHVITGEMRAGVNAVPLPGGGARVQGGTDHDIFEEFGTRYRPPHPWLRPSMPAAAAG